jgi:hypothetical protein
VLGSLVLSDRHGAHGLSRSIVQDCWVRGGHVDDMDHLAGRPLRLSLRGGSLLLRIISLVPQYSHYWRDLSIFKMEVMVRLAGSSKGGELQIGGRTFHVVFEHVILVPGRRLLTQ